MCQEHFLGRMPRKLNSSTPLFVKTVHFLFARNSQRQVLQECPFPNKNQKIIRAAARLFALPFVEACLEVNTQVSMNGSSELTKQADALNLGLQTGIMRKFRENFFELGCGSDILEKYDSKAVAANQLAVQIRGDLSKAKELKKEPFPHEVKAFKKLVKARADLSCLFHAVISEAAWVQNIVPELQENLLEKWDEATTGMAKLVNIKPQKCSKARKRGLMLSTKLQAKKET